MVGFPGEWIPLAQNALGWMGVVLQLSGFVICLRYVRLSWAMPLLVLAFAGYAGVGIGSRLLLMALNRQILFSEGAARMSLALGVLNVAAGGMLTCGLLLVFRDVRERFHFLREAQFPARAADRGGDPVAGEGA
jgi:hypothetical protein